MTRYFLLVVAAIFSAALFYFTTLPASLGLIIFAIMLFLISLLLITQSHKKRWAPVFGFSTVFLVSSLIVFF